MSNNAINAVFYLAILVILGLLTPINAQTTEFSYQGVLKTSGIPANGVYDFEFKLFDALSGGTQQGATIQMFNVVVSNGVYAVSLDLGSGVFTGEDRFLDISVRAVSGGGFAQLSPRQKITSVPYSVRSSNAAAATTAVNATTAANFTGTLAGDVTGPQIATLIANNAVTTAKIANSSVTDEKVVDVAGNKIIGTIPVAAVPGGSASYIQNQNAGPQASSNFFIGGNGVVNGTLSGSVVNSATQYNIAGSRILGNTGTNNLFAGIGAGAAITFGNANSFFGSGAGTATTFGQENSFFGNRAGEQNTGSGNSFFGDSAGKTNSGESNSFVGRAAGQSNTTGGQNSFFGYATGLGNTAGGGNSFFGRVAGNMNTSGNNNTALGSGADFSADNLSFATTIGANAIATASNQVQLGRSGGDTVSIGSFLSGGSTTICAIDAVLAYCSSSRRYKEDIRPFTLGLKLVRQLQPVSFDWKGRDENDFGLIAEDVAAIERLLVTRNSDGKIEGIKYDHLGVVLVNAVKEQQDQIENLRDVVNKQQVEVESLKQLLCSIKKELQICGHKK